MDVADQLSQLLTTHVRGLRPTPSGWLKADCPMCVHRGHRPDRRQRFGVKLDAHSVGANCFNCGFHAKWSTGDELRSDMRTLLNTVGVSHTDIDRLVFEAYVNKHSLPNHSATPLQGTVQQQWPTVSLPEHAQCVLSWLESGHEHSALLEVAQYALSRGIEDLQRVWWSPDRTHQMQHRMIVPFEWQGRTVGYTARHVRPGVPAGLRYHHSVPANYVFNLDAQRDYDRCHTIVTEGAIDALLVDGVSVQHNRVSAGQAQLINSLHTKITVCADRDSAGDGLVQAALEHGWAVSFPPWERGIKDAGDAVQAYGRLYTVHSIIAHRVTDPDKIRLWRQLELEKHGNHRVHA